MKTKQIFTRVAAGLAAITLIFSLETTTVSAARGRNFVDANQDGVCDYCGTGCSFVDENGDGICDNFASGTCQGQGRQEQGKQGHGRGKGCGRRCKR